MEKKVLVGSTPSEITAFVNSQKLPRYLALEVLRWVYKHGAKSFDEMTNLSLNARKMFAKHYVVGLQSPIKCQESTDGTKKYLYSAVNGKFIETAYIPEENRNTLCVSSQVGCKMGCRFCMTARQGLQGQLTAGDILNQIISLPEREKISNIVFMGMGEPFDNTDEVMKSIDIITADYGLKISTRKINVSTIGLVPGMKRFIKESKCNLAISLHSPFDEERKKLMPVQRLYPIEQVLQVLKENPFDRHRKLSFEYIMFKDINDTDDHIKQLARILNGLRCKINLMHYHPIPGASLKGTDSRAIFAFQEKLNAKGILATVRKTRGEDISAACGMLSTGGIEKNS